MLIGCIRSTIPVALKAREVLILCQMPSYDDRSVQMEAVLRQSSSPAYYGDFKSTQGLVSWLSFGPSMLIP